MAKQKLEGFTTLYLPTALCLVLPVVIIQQFLTADVFQGFWLSVLQVVFFTTATYFIVRWRSKPETFDGEPDAYNQQKIYQASTFTYWVTGISLGLNIWLILS